MKNNFLFFTTFLCLLVVSQNSDAINYQKPSYCIIPFGTYTVKACVGSSCTGSALSGINSVFISSSRPLYVVAYDNSAVIGWSVINSLDLPFNNPIQNGGIMAPNGDWILWQTSDWPSAAHIRAYQYYPEDNNNKSLEQYCRNYFS